LTLKVSELSGVEHSNADSEEGVVEVRYDDGRVTTDELRGAIEGAGYTVTA
jgi:copper chaperone CopZ